MCPVSAETAVDSALLSLVHVLLTRFHIGGRQHIVTFLEGEGHSRQGISQEKENVS